MDSFQWLWHIPVTGTTPVPIHTRPRSAGHAATAFVASSDLSGSRGGSAPSWVKVALDGRDTGLEEERYHSTFSRRKHAHEAMDDASDGTGSTSSGMDEGLVWRHEADWGAAQDPILRLLEVGKGVVEHGVLLPSQVYTHTIDTLPSLICFPPPVGVLHRVRSRCLCGGRWTTRFKGCT